MLALRDALFDPPGAALVDLLESEAAYFLALDLSSVTAEAAELRIEKGRLVVETRHDRQLPAEFDYVREERPLFFDAEVPLPPDVVADEAEASMERGMLGIRLPKREAAPEWTISITTGDEDA